MNYFESFMVRGWRRYSCVECGCIYRCRFERQAIGAGDTPEKAHTSAIKSTADPFTRDLDAPACPECGLVPPRMIGNIRYDAPAKPTMVGAIGAAVLIALGAAKGAPHDNSAMLLAFWATIIVAWQWVVTPRDPNRDRESNRAASAAMLARGRMAVLRPGRSDFVTPVTLPATPGLVWVLGVLAVPVPVLPQLLESLTGWGPAWFWWVAVLASGVLSLAMGVSLSVLASSLIEQSPSALVERLDGTGGNEIVLLPDLPSEEGTADEGAVEAPVGGTPEGHYPPWKKPSDCGNKTDEHVLRELTRDDPEDERHSRGTLYIGGTMVMIGLGLLAWQWSWINEVNRGPVPITEAELRQLDDPSALRDTYVTFNFTETKETGLGVKRGAKWESKYLLVRVQDRWVLASVPAEYGGSQITGRLSRLDARGSKFDANALAQIRSLFPNHQLAPFCFQASQDQQSAAGSLVTVVGLLVLIGSGFCIFGVVRLLRT